MQLADQDDRVWLHYLEAGLITPEMHMELMTSRKGKTVVRERTYEPAGYGKGKAKGMGKPSPFAWETASEESEIQLESFDEPAESSFQHPGKGYRTGKGRREPKPQGREWQKVARKTQQTTYELEGSVLLLFKMLETPTEALMY